MYIVVKTLLIITSGLETLHNVD